MVAVWALLAGGCGASGGRDSPSLQKRPLAIGFLYVGSVRDSGYNAAAYSGSVAVGRAFPHARIIQRQYVPESAEAERVMEAMIDKGASIVFPTSFGHLGPALRVAARHPEVTFLHQGGLETAPNLGTYFGTIWEGQYAAGQAAGMATRTDRLGYVAAFPIAQGLLSINAFQLGARSVNPRARTRVVFTSSWCDPARQRRAARTVLGWGADVVAQHQDCTATVIGEAARSGARVTGYHYDARSLAPDAWLTGPVWDWGRLYVDMVRTVIGGRFAHSPYSGRYRAGLREGAVRLASFGDAAGPAIRSRVQETYRRLRDGSLEPFRGPIRDQRGRLRIAGEQPSITDLEEVDYLVRGVVGRLETS